VAGGQELSPAERKQLCEAFLNLAGIGDRSTRDLYIAELERQLGSSLPVPRHADARRDVFSLVNTCLEYPGAVHALVVVVEFFHRDSRPFIELKQLAERLLPGLPLRVQERSALCQLLAGVDRARVSAAWRTVNGGTGDEEVDWGDVDGVIRRLEAYGKPADELAPPLLLFVECVAHDIGGRLSVDLHRWIDGTGARVGLDQDALRRLCVEWENQAAPREPGNQSGEAEAGESAGAALDESTNDTGHDDPNPPTGDSGEDPLTVTSQPSGRSSSSPAELLTDVQPYATIWNGVPARNPDFTGREDLLLALRRVLVSRERTAVVPQALHGLGGVGKTQLAVEYVYRYAGDYDLVWWIPAEQSSQVKASLSGLANQLGLPSSLDMAQTASAVLEALRTRRRNWLLVYDNADEPEDLEGLIPAAGGHVLVTSRNLAWAHPDRAVEVDVFERDESLALLKKRVDGISSTEADELSAKLGDLPLALEQAATWLAQTGMPVIEYLREFDLHVAELMSEGKPLAYPRPVAATFAFSFERLGQESRAAFQLLQLFAFLGAEPVSVALLRSARNADLLEPLGSTLGDTIEMNRAVRLLRRYALARVTPSGQKLQVHRLVQAVLREKMTPDERLETQRNVHRLLAAINPQEPDDSKNWPTHGEITPHVLPSGLINSDEPTGRQVVLDQVRYLYSVGDYESSRDLGEEAVRVWRKKFGPDDQTALIAGRHLANTLRALGETKRAGEMNQDVLDRMKRILGEEHEHTLATANSVGRDLRVLGRFRDAMQLDEDNLERHRQVYGDENDPNTLRCKNNLAVDLRLLGDFRAAREHDEDIVRRRKQSGTIDRDTLTFDSNLVRDLYGMGEYEEALNLQQRSIDRHRDRLGRTHDEVLLANRNVGICLRKLGDYEAALKHSDQNYQDYHTRFGPDHEHTLAATISFANCLRTIGDLNRAQTLASEATTRYQSRFGAEHPLTLAARTNFAIILRAQNDFRAARQMDVATLDALARALGEEHPYSLCTASNLTNDLNEAHEVTEAQALSELTYERSRRLRGVDHPYTLSCAVNLAADLQNTGDELDGQALLDRTLTELQRKLGANHPETADARRGMRAECDIEPPPT
jgi:tetratricopeptide (TPR) repeat protein